MSGNLGVGTTTATYPITANGTISGTAFYDSGLLDTTNSSNWTSVLSYHSKQNVTITWSVGLASSTTCNITFERIGNTVTLLLTSNLSGTTNSSGPSDVGTATSVYQGTTASYIIN